MRRCLSARGSWRLYEMRAHLGDVVAVAVYGAPVTTLSSGGFRAVRSWGCRTASGRAEPINQLISTARSSRRIPGASKRTFIAPPAALAAGCESRFSARQCARGESRRRSAGVTWLVGTRCLANLQQTEFGQGNLLGLPDLMDRPDETARVGLFPDR